MYAEEESLPFDHKYEKSPVPPKAEIVAQPSDRPWHETESLENVVRIWLGWSTNKIESTVHPLASVTSIVCKPAGALEFAVVPPKLQLKVYVGVPPAKDKYTLPLDSPKQRALSDEIDVISKISGSVIEAFATAIQPELSVTVSV